MLGTEVVGQHERERSMIPAEDFAVPQKRLLPMHTEQHARSSWDQLDSTNGLEEHERQDARHRIARAAR